MRHVFTLIKRALGSRKFWAAVMASAPFAVGALSDTDPLAMVDHWENFALVWMAYAGIQGTVDALEGHGVKRLNGGETPTETPTETPLSGDEAVPYVIAPGEDVSTVQDGPIESITDGPIGSTAEVED